MAIFKISSSLVAAMVKASSIASDLSSVEVLPVTLIVASLIYTLLPESMELYMKLPAIPVDALPVDKSTLASPEADIILLSLPDFTRTYPALTVGTTPVALPLAIYALALSTISFTATLAAMAKPFLALLT